MKIFIIDICLLSKKKKKKKKVHFLFCRVITKNIIELYKSYIYLEN